MWRVICRALYSQREEIKRQTLAMTYFNIYKEQAVHTETALLSTVRQSKFKQNFINIENFKQIGKLMLSVK